ncbi:unnamed protein product [Lactuca saligna]|uniref:RRM domain-containing protein n=1 Tax=Lactuca saligna TaxID=75948 RepID=A0AA35US21_LACSI|nr:unnamed protein product [Lactuca saligna]
MMGDNSWTTVSHRNRNVNVHGNCRDHHSSQEPRTTHVRSDIISLFVTNFPDFVQAEDIQRVCGRACSRLGKIIGVFIAKKLSKLGKRFGFIRFSGDCNCDSLLKQLHEVWFGSYKLFASLPRSLGNNNRTPRTVGLSTAVHRNVNVKCYVNVVRGLPNNMRNITNME